MSVGAGGGPERAVDPSDRQVAELRYTGVMQPCRHPAEQILSVRNFLEEDAGHLKG